jgi:aspartyl protease family protein
VDARVSSFSAPACDIRPLKPHAAQAMSRFLFPALAIAAVSVVGVSVLDQTVDSPARSVGASAKAGAGQSAARQAAQGTRTVVLTAAGSHFAAEARVDGRPVDFMVDTGASYVTLRASDASRLGYNPRDRDYRVRVSTANGEGRAAAIELDRLEVGEITVRDVPALVVVDDALAVNLLGMSFLSRVRFQYERGQMILEQ